MHFVVARTFTTGYCQKMNPEMQNPAVMVIGADVFICMQSVNTRYARVDSCVVLQIAPVVFGFLWCGCVQTANCAQNTLHVLMHPASLTGLVG